MASQWPRAGGASERTAAAQPRPRRAAGPPNALAALTHRALLYTLLYYKCLRRALYNSRHRHNPYLLAPKQRNA